MKDIEQAYKEFIYKRTYSRWLPELGRRERWDETIDRYRDYFLPRVPECLRDEYLYAIEAFRDTDSVGSMRALWTAGPALDADNIAGYNCAYTPIDTVRRLAEVLYILMNGAGVGISVERQYINQLPPMAKAHIKNKSVKVVFEDSKYGWAQGFWEYLQHLYEGVIPAYDLSKIRPKGARLKTFGGRASGPEPLRNLLDFVTKVAVKAQGRKLNSEEIADIACKIADIVIVGGVRRSAILILSNPSDRRMANFKTGEFWVNNPHRALANISACYTEKPDPVTYMEDFLDLMKSGTGERGIVNREALRNLIPERRDPNHEFGVNPCGEIILRPQQFCNLSEVVVRPGMDMLDLHTEVEYAVLLGIVQSTMTNFHFLSDEWRKNTEEEHLLGVSLTGQMDNPEILTEDNLDTLRYIANKAARKYAEKMDIPYPTAVTCVKPSGTVSQLVGAASGLHPRHAPYYIRRVRVAATDPVAKFLMSEGVPCSPEVGETWDNLKTVVFEFPLKSPKTSVCRGDVSAIDQLDHWLKLKKFWTDHNPSVTIHVQDDEWVQVAAWLWEHWDYLGGITCMPHAGGHYQLAPYEEINQETYQELVEKFPQDLDWTRLDRFETRDNTTGAQELACVAGGCEII